MSAPHQISVIVPTYNALDLLKRTVRSLENQVVKGFDIEVIIVDDASGDSTVQWLNKYNGNLEFTLIVNGRNSGRAASRNIGVRASRGDLLIFIDGDMEFGDKFIQQHVESHIDKNSVVIGIVIHHKALRNKAYSRYLKTRGLFKLNSSERINGRFFLSGNSSLSRKLFNSSGGFDESIPYGEDIDFGIRLIKAGGFLIYNPLLTVTHLHIRSLKGNLKVFREFGKNSLPILIRKHPELYAEFRLNWLEGTSVSRMVKRVVFSRLVFGTLYALAYALSNLAVPAFVYKYLIFYSYYNGYQASLEE